MLLPRQSAQCNMKTFSSSIQRQFLSKNIKYRLYFYEGFLMQFFTKRKIRELSALSS